MFRKSGKSSSVDKAIVRLQQYWVIRRTFWHSDKAWVNLGCFGYRKLPAGRWRVFKTVKTKQVIHVHASSQAESTDLEWNKVARWKLHQLKFYVPQNDLYGPRLQFLWWTRTEVPFSLWTPTGSKAHILPRVFFSLEIHFLFIQEIL